MRVDRFEEHGNAGRVHLVRSGRHMLNRGDRVFGLVSQSGLATNQVVKDFVAEKFPRAWL